MSDVDPLKLDRTLRETADAWQYWRAALRSDPSDSGDPFERTRWATGHQTFSELCELSDDVPIAGRLRAWVYRLAEQRINGAHIWQLAVLRRFTAEPSSQLDGDPLSVAALMSGLVADEARRGHYAEALAERGAPLTLRHIVLWQRRQELAERMGLSGPDEVESPSSELCAIAEELLSQSDAIYDGIGIRNLGAFVCHGLGHNSPAVWPALISSRSLSSWFADTDLFASLSPELENLPAPHAPASFLRALYAVGHAWERAAGPTDQPFVVARDPYNLRAHQSGFLFGALPLQASFAKRFLDVDRSRFEDHRRALSRSVLLHVRSLAMRVLLRQALLSGEKEAAERFLELSNRAFGDPLLPNLFGVIFRTRLEDPQRLAGALLALAQNATLTEEHNNDWFRNPTAAEQLRCENQLPPHVVADQASLRLGLSELMTLVEHAAV